MEAVVKDHDFNHDSGVAPVSLTTEDSTAASPPKLFASFSLPPPPPPPRVTSLKISNPIAPFLSKIKFEVEIEIHEPLQQDMEMSVVYVGDSKSAAGDQVLDEVLVGPFAVGVSKFQHEVDPPQWQKIPRADLIGPSVLFFNFKLEGKRINHIGFFVNNYYSSEPETNSLASSPQIPISGDGWPEPHVPERIVRDILASQPRVRVDALNFILPPVPVAAPISTSISSEESDEYENHEEGESLGEEDTSSDDGSDDEEGDEESTPGGEDDSNEDQEDSGEEFSESDDEETDGNESSNEEKEERERENRFSSTS